MDPLKEKLRLKEAKQYIQHVSSLKEKLNDILVLATEVTGISVAYISLIDEHIQHIAVQQGEIIIKNELPISQSICAHTLEQDDILIVEDTTTDDRFKSLPVVTMNPGIKFYAGIPLKTSDGLNVGTLCVVNSHPHHLTPNHIEALKALSRQVTYLMKLNISNQYLKKSIEEIEKKNKALRQVAQLQSHEIRGPLTTIMSIIQLINDEDAPDNKEYINLLRLAVNNFDQKIRSIVKITSEAGIQSPIHEVKN